MKKRILFNIWDDYYDDGIGNLQETDGYVVEHMTDEEKTPIAKMVYDYIMENLDMTGVKVEYKGIKIHFKNLTHVRREYMLERLEKCKLIYNGKSIEFISES